MGRVWSGVAVAALVLFVAGCGDCNTGVLPGRIDPESLYTTAADFARGTAVNLDGGAGGGGGAAAVLTLKAATSTFPFIWIALSARGTICRIDTDTGEILGEYRTMPDELFGNPSRTTVALDGSVWAGNRSGASLIHIGLPEANQAVDRNGNGTIETSEAYGDVLPWPHVSDPISVSTAEDEAILHFVPTLASATRHVCVNADNDVWVSGRFGSNDSVFQLVDGETGAILRTEGPFAAGGYGGLIDRNGVIWSASSSGPLLRWDPDLPIDGTNPKIINIPNYGLAVDPSGWIWVTSLSGNQIRKVSPDGDTVLGPFEHGSDSAQGVAVTANGHVWVSSSLIGGTTVGHLLNDGTFLGNVTGVGNGSTGVAVDSKGKVWTANINSSDATRIDPSAGPIGSDMVTPIGAVDLTVPLPGASPYNYSDMTGAVALGATSPQGTWRVVRDGVHAGQAWERIVWNTEPEGAVPPGASIVVEARAADTSVGLGSQSFVAVANGGPLGLVGRFIEVRVTLKKSVGGASPVLSDIAIIPAASPAP